MAALSPLDYPAELPACDGLTRKTREPTDGDTG